MTSFSPGPWEVVPSGSIDTDGDAIRAVGDGTTFIAEDVYGANARLIAAAPELYEALDALLGVVRARQLSPALLPGGVVDVAAMAYADTVLTVARAALAKAEGKS